MKLEFVILTRGLVSGGGAVCASWHRRKGQYGFLVTLDLVADWLGDSWQDRRLVRLVERW